MDSSAEINRLELIGACAACVRRIRAARQQKIRERDEKEEKEIERLMTARFDWWGRPVTVTRERALEIYRSKRDTFEERLNDPNALYRNQETVAHQLQRLAESSDADTVRVTRQDFDWIEAYFRR